MKIVNRVFLVFGLLVLSVFLSTQQVSAYSSYFGSKCAGCHTNDNATCNGCHHHGSVGLSAVTDKSAYGGGEQVTVTLSGGTKSGWIRALLFDQNGFEIARATGPTGMGDDALPNPVVFPVAMSAPAPAVTGHYTWEAAWWGSPYDVGNLNVYPHGPEVRTQVVVNVTTTPVEDATWGRLKALFR